MVANASPADPLEHDPEAPRAFGEDHASKQDVSVRGWLNPRRSRLAVRRDRGEPKSPLLKRHARATSADARDRLGGTAVFGDLPA